MNVTLAFIRVLFFILSVFFMTVYMIGSTGNQLANALIGAAIGAVFGGCLIGFSYYFRRYNLRSFNIIVIGIFFGYLLGLGLNLIFDAILNISKTSVTGEPLENLAPRVIEMIKVGLFLFGIFLGTLLTLRAADELYVSIPFIKFTPTAQKKKDILIDISVLSDARIIDLAASGLLDNHLIIPRFIIKDLYAQAETGDENSRSKARRCLEVIKKLEITTSLELRYNDTDFPEARDLTNKMIRLARLLDANIMTADITRVQMATIEGVRIVNIHTLSNALKPLMQTGETINIKIQRYGKEPRQGVGYLEDGTMVVVNGGGNFIGHTIQAQVLSVKHTTSGRMIFCNAFEEDGYVEDGQEYEEEDEEI